MTQTVTQVLEKIPNIEEPKHRSLSKTHKEILEFLSRQRNPKLAKTISTRLNLSKDSTRARLHELSKMGLVYQPLKGITMNDVGINGQLNSFAGKKCGYLVKLNK